MFDFFVWQINHSNEVEEKKESPSIYLFLLSRLLLSLFEETKKNHIISNDGA